MRAKYSFVTRGQVTAGEEGRAHVFVCFKFATCDHVSKLVRIQQLVHPPTGISVGYFFVP